MLSRDYEQQNLMFYLLRANIEKTGSTEAYVTLHLSSRKKFKLNVGNVWNNLCQKKMNLFYFSQGKESRVFEVTRYLCEEDIGLVFHGSGRSASNQQPIHAFHAELDDLKFLQIYDPVINDRMRPICFELNQMLTNALGAQHLRQCFNLDEKNKRMDPKVASVLVAIHKKYDDKATVLTKLRTLECVILEKQVSNLREDVALDGIDLSGEYRQVAEKCENMQNHRFEAYSRANEGVQQIQSCSDPFDSDVFCGMLHHLCKTINELAGNIQRKPIEDDGNQSHSRIDSPVIAHMTYFQKLVDNLERNISWLRENNITNQIGGIIKEIPAHLMEYTLSIEEEFAHQTNEIERFLMLNGQRYDQIS